MIKVKQFVNELMTSNCFIVWDNETHHCVIIDPGSEKAEKEAQFITNHQLVLDYIILTHEHTDHTWGVNALIEKYDTKVVCSTECENYLPLAGNYYFQYYYDDPNYSYTVKRVDITTESICNRLLWNGVEVSFIPTPGHSVGSMCILMENMLFSGDTLMQYKLRINKKSGSKEQLKETINGLLTLLPRDIIVFPGHGKSFILLEYKMIS